MTCLNNIINKKTIINIKTDSLKFGLAIAISQIFTKKNINIKIILLSLIGFATYQIIISRIINTENMDIRKRVPVDDFFKFATMLFVSKFLITGQLYLDKKFVVDNINIIIALFLYNAFISKYITPKIITNNIITSAITFRDVMTINDTVKYSFVLIVAGLLNDLAGIDNFSAEYLKLAAGYVSGLVTYNYVFS